MLMLVFALPEEARAVSRRVRWNKSSTRIAQGLLKGQQVSLAFAGIGGSGISHLERLMELNRPRMLISSGFAGATRSLLEAGDFVLATNYTDPDMVKVLSQQKIVDASGLFVQVQHLASVADKWSLNRSVGSIAVDMESEMIANVCRRRRVSLVTIRMLSDAIDETIPVLFTGKKVSKVSDLTDAAIFAARMLRLTEKLADRLEELILLAAVR